jgi:hypothetical protein
MPKADVVFEPPGAADSAAGWLNCPLSAPVIARGGALEPPQPVGKMANTASV